MRNSALLVAMAVLALSVEGRGWMPKARAAYIMSIQQAGGDVVMTGSGAINTSSLTVAGQASLNPRVDPIQGIAVAGATPMRSVILYQGITGRGLFGLSTGRIPTSGSGPLAGVWVTLNSVVVPVGYVSGTDLGTSMDTFSQTTIAGMGLREGTYTYTWGSGDNADNLVVLIGGNSTPEVGSLGLVGVGGMLMLRRRRG